MEEKEIHKKANIKRIQQTAETGERYMSELKEQTRSCEEKNECSVSNKMVVPIFQHNGSISFTSALIKKRSVTSVWQWILRKV